MADAFPQQTTDLSSLNPDRLKYGLEVEKILGQMVAIYSVDLNNDGQNELVYQCSHDSSVPDMDFIEIINPELGDDYLRQNIVGRPTLCEYFYDLDGDGSKEIFVSECLNDTTYFQILNINDKKSLRIALATKPKGTKRVWDCIIDVVGVMDANGDGFPDLILSISTFLAYQPRKIVCFDFRRQKVQWEYRFGLMPCTAHLADIDGDTKREIITGSTAPNNCQGIPENGTDDRHSYILVLDSLGHKRSLKEVGGERTTAILAVDDMDNDGESDILIFRRRGNDPEKKSHLGYWNKKNSAFGKTMSFENDLFNKPLIFDADRDGVKDILMFWRDGMIEIRNKNFEPIALRQFPLFTPLHFTLTDLDNNGEEEIFLDGIFKGQQLLMVFDRKLSILGSFQQPAGLCGGTNNFHSTGFNRNKLLIVRRTTDNKILFLRFSRQYLKPFLLSRPERLYGLILALLLTATSLVLRSMRKKHQYINRAFRAFSDTLGIGFLFLDGGGHVTEWNDTLRRMLGRISALEKKVRYDKVFRGTVYEKVSDIIQNAFSNQTDLYEKELSLVKDDSIQNILVSAIGVPRPGRRNDNAKMVCIQDVTGLVESKNAVLWSGMAQRLAHELKTPLSSVMLSAQKIRLEANKTSGHTHAFEKYIAHITGQVDRLRKMTDSFMKLARVEKPEFVKTGINNLINDVLSRSRLKIASGVEVKTEFASDLPQINLDKEQFGIALGNLIDNALTAMEGKGILAVTTRSVQSIHTHDRDGEGIQIEISDTGKGMPKDYRDHLFQPFFTRSVSGTGLGLVIVKKIVEDHHGVIRIESEEGIGTTVFIALPLHSPGNHA